MDSLRTESFDSFALESMPAERSNHIYVNAILLVPVLTIAMNAPIASVQALKEEVAEALKALTQH
ncbi:hypothetical protein [Rhodanobacter sp. MP7CTX1]|uniref:hypothetical protein n=1 Tax=Rhodanobacter sp. MP7CTX1 TaxID=2723084 RepID=UPI00161CF60D|nr:hypothetical protein [Rhodanobacter sp. MP7CTX1]MBB6187962.1 hypothetical protein [Rhodanobacter sp. MP7CTX1]